MKTFIHRDNYLSLSARAPRRLAMLKASAASNDWSTPKTWRDVRFLTFKTLDGLSGGFNGTGKAREAVWSTQNPNAALPREKFCDELEGVRIEHKGWFSDTSNSDVARGIVSALPHGRFVAGYIWTSNDERVYFGQIFYAACDAARMADQHARVFAEYAMQDSEKFDAAQSLESDIETASQRLRECLALRNRACMKHVRDEIADLLSTIRDARASLRTDYADYL
jgi:hypothetical protein